jgi:predicted secreted Zn-dependent protease
MQRHARALEQELRRLRADVENDNARSMRHEITESVEIEKGQKR